MKKFLIAVSLFLLVASLFLSAFTIAPYDTPAENAPPDAPAIPPDAPAGNAPLDGSDTPDSLGRPGSLKGNMPPNDNAPVENVEIEVPM